MAPSSPWHGMTSVCSCHICEHYPARALNTNNTAWTWCNKTPPLSHTKYS